jgi:hypothetical protein
MKGKGIKAGYIGYLASQRAAVIDDSADLRESPFVKTFV